MRNTHFIFYLSRGQPVLAKNAFLASVQSLSWQIFLASVCLEPVLAKNAFLASVQGLSWQIFLSSPLSVSSLSWYLDHSVSVSQHC